MEWDFAGHIFFISAIHQYQMIVVVVIEAATTAMMTTTV